MTAVLAEDDGLCFYFASPAALNALLDRFSEPLAEGSVVFAVFQPPFSVEGT